MIGTDSHLRWIALALALGAGLAATANDPGFYVHRFEYDTVVSQLEAGGLPLKADRDQAWADFGGWRVNYDNSLIELCNLVMAPYAAWSSDRGIPHHR